MTKLSKEIIELSNQPCFSNIMKELGYEKVIHCKDCAWRYFSRASGEYYCFEFNVPVTDTGFCSKAERKEE